MIQAINIKNFRNFSDVFASFSPRVNIFLGDNGQGKTNLLEALYVLTNGHSFRYADNENLLMKNTNESLLKSKVTIQELDYDIQVHILKSRKHHMVNGKKTTASELSKKFPCVIFSPESLAVIKEGADQRRQLLDELLVSFHPSNANLLMDFRRALKTRNKILKNFIAQVSDRNETENLLESLNPRFLNLAVELSLARTQALKGIYTEFNNAMQYISNRKDVDISVDYVISDQKALNFSAEEIEKLFQNRMVELHSAELAAGVSLVGPQKHDVVFLYGGNDSRFYCSQGQQRALILSFKMAQIVYHRKIHGIYPLLMLDDVLSELDAEKRDSLIRFLSEINTQIFITTTDFSLPNSMGSEECAVLKVREGQIGI